MSTDILVVDCGSTSGTDSVFALLDGLRAEAVRSVEELQQHSQDLKFEPPCAVILVAYSGDIGSRGLVDEALRSVELSPVLVIDELFDEDAGRQLLERGAQDYLDRSNLTSAKLLRRIEWAVIRNGHRLVDRDGKAPELRQSLDALPRRERQILELLACGLAPKQIAARCGTSRKTVWNQLASLRRRFDVASNHALCLRALQLTPKEKLRE